MDHSMTSTFHVCRIESTFDRSQETQFCTHELLDNGIGKIRIPKFTWNENIEAGEDSSRDAALEEAKDQMDAAFCGR